MAETKPLRLKAQRVSSKVVIAENSPVAQICVDTGVFHLQNNFDYSIPNNLSDVIAPGVLVKVPFGKSEVLGYVVSREPGELELSKLKPISKVVSELSLLSEELIEIISDTCERYACKPWDLVKSAIPPRAAGAEKNFAGRTPKPIRSVKLQLNHEFVIVSNTRELAHQIAELLKASGEGEQLLVIVPDERDIKQLAQFEYQCQPLILSSDLEKTERYRNYLSARFDFPKFILGNRSAIFTPLQPNSKILILNDGDESMYERRFPGWNVRDVALLRSADFSLIFASASPSLEVARLSQLGWIKARTANVERLKGPAITFNDSFESDIAIIKKGLKVGNVLVVMAESGYVNAISCQKCRNQGLCECAGKLFIAEKGGAPTCYLCGKIATNWRCSWCDGETIRAISRGSSRYVEEISKAVPGTRVLLSKGGSRLDVLPKLTENVLVISTYGCEPDGEYAGVVLRSLENLTNRIDLRSLEFVRRLVFENLGKVSNSNGGCVYVDLPASHPFSQGLLRADPMGLTNLEIVERKSSNLPPYTRVATITGEGAAVRVLANQIKENDLFASVSVISNTSASGASSKSINSSKLILRASIENSAQFSEFLRDLARYRSLKGLSPLSIRIDPYSI